MEENIITVYIDDKPYHFKVTTNHRLKSTTYHISAEEEEDFIPQDFTITENGRVEIEGSLRTVEREQIARLVWQEIINKTKP